MTQEEIAQPERGSAIVDIVTIAALTISSVGLSISLAALIFSGSSADGLQRGAVAFVIGAGIVSLLLAARSALVPLVAISQDAPAVVLIAVVANLVERDATVEAADIFVMLAVLTLATGLMLLALGALGKSHVVRYLPQTVVGGFVAGTGWLLFKGGVEVMSRTRLELGSLDDVFSWSLAQFWLPGVVLGLTVLVLSRHPDVPVAASSGSVVAAVVVFVVVVAATSSFAAVEAGGWFIGPFDDSAGLSIVAASEITSAPWASFGGETIGLVSALLVAIVALLLNLSGLESVTGTRLDLDREVRSAGFANLLAAPFGAIPAFHALGDTELGRQMGVTRRRVPVAVGAVTIIVGLVGTKFVGFVPRFIPGGLLIAVGLGLLTSWVQELRRMTSRLEAGLSVAVLACIAVIGILEGVLLGLLAACIIFVWRYSQVDPVRRELSGAVLRSRVDRTSQEAIILDRLGGTVLVYELHGYLFFGSMIRLSDTVTERCGAELAGDRVNEVIFEIRRVSGMDSSAMTLLGQLVTALSSGGVTVRLVVDGSTLLGESSTLPLVHPSLDEALEQAEARLLQSAQVEDENSEVQDIPAILKTGNHFEHRRGEPGTVLATEGTPSDGMLFLVEGEASASIAAPNGQRHRLRRFQAPAWVGEVGFLTGAPRSADVIADTAIEYVVIDQQRWDQLLETEPAITAELLGHLAIRLGERTASLSTALARALD